MEKDISLLELNNKVVALEVNFKNGQKILEESTNIMQEVKPLIKGKDDLEKMMKDQMELRLNNGDFEKALKETINEEITKAYNKKVINGMIWFASIGGSVLVTVLAAWLGGFFK